MEGGSIFSNMSGNFHTFRDVFVKTITENLRNLKVFASVVDGISWEDSTCQLEALPGILQHPAMEQTFYRSEEMAERLEKFALGMKAGEF